jgi:hypothetical protein
LEITIEGVPIKCGWTDAENSVEQVVG